MESQTIMNDHDTDVQIHVEYQSGSEDGNTVHVHNLKYGTKEELFRYPVDIEDEDLDHIIEEKIKNCDIFERAYNLKKREKLDYLKKQVKKAVEMMMIKGR
jgi:Zn-finger domain-containing protein